MEGGTLLEADNGVFWMGAILTLVVADRPEALPMWDQTMAEAHRNGSVFSRLSVTLWDGCLKLVRGELAEAEESLTSNLSMIKSYGINVPEASSYSYAFLAGVYLEMGDVEAARRALDGVPTPEGDFSHGTNFARRSLVGLHMAEGNGELALEAAEDLEQHSVRTRNPRWMPWRSLKGEALAMLGRREEAVALVEDEVAIAREWGTPSGLGHSLRVLGELRGPEGLDELEEAAALLERSDQRIERARAFAALGAEVRRARRPTEAREPLRRALELAERAGARLLAENVRSELYATGARPRSTALDGVESLTERELRVATLAAGGQTNRDIAQALYVTPKTVEVHLTNAYRKLNIGSRRELPAALAS
jgi:ATP/maltotriose-dependent transcriptional regulator MalT